MGNAMTRVRWRLSVSPTLRQTPGADGGSVLPPPEGSIQGHPHAVSSAPEASTIAGVGTASPEHVTRQPLDRVADVDASADAGAAIKIKTEEAAGRPALASATPRSRDRAHSPVAVASAVPPGTLQHHLIARIEKSFPYVQVLRVVRDCAHHTVVFACCRPGVSVDGLSRTFFMKAYWQPGRRRHTPSEVAIAAHLIRATAGADHHLLLPRMVPDRGTPAMFFERFGSDLTHLAVPLSLVRVARAAVQLLAAVSNMHMAGVLHCDIKPENVLLRGGVVRLCDFGSAHADKRLVPWEVVLDRTPPVVDAARRRRPFVGTFRYMAPEVWLDAPLSTATDIWGVGQVLFYLLEGRAAFHEAHRGAWTLDAIRRQGDAILHYRALPWRRCTHAGLRALVETMLRHNPSQRPDMVDCIQELSHILIELARTASPATAPAGPYSPSTASHLGAISISGGGNGSSSSTAGYPSSSGAAFSCDPASVVLALA